MLAIYESCPFSESWMESRYSDPGDWIRANQRLIKEGNRKLLWTRDKEKRRQIIDEIRWRQEEIQLLKNKLTT